MFVKVPGTVPVLSRNPKHEHAFSIPLYYLFYLAVSSLSCTSILASSLLLLKLEIITS